MEPSQPGAELVKRGCQSVLRIQARVRVRLAEQTPTPTAPSAALSRFLRICGGIPEPRRLLLKPEQRAACPPGGATEPSRPRRRKGTQALEQATGSGHPATPRLHFRWRSGVWESPLCTFSLRSCCESCPLWLSTCSSFCCCVPLALFPCPRGVGPDVVGSSPNTGSHRHPQGSDRSPCLSS